MDSFKKAIKKHNKVAWSTGETKQRHKLIKSKHGWLNIAMGVTFASMGIIGGGMTASADTNSNTTAPAISQTVNNNTSSNAAQSDKSIQDTNNNNDSKVATLTSTLTTNSQNTNDSDTGQKETKANTNNDQENKLASNNNEIAASNTDQNVKTDNVTKNDTPVVSKTDTQLTTQAQASSDTPANPKDITVSITGLPNSSAENPIKSGQNITYTITVTNTSNDGGIIPKGTTIDLDFSAPGNGSVAFNDFMKYVGSSAGNIFTTEDNGNGHFSIILNQDLKPGVYNTILNFLSIDPGYNWNGQNPDGSNPSLVSSTASVTYHYQNQQYDGVINAGQTINIMPNAKSGNITPPIYVTPGMTGSGIDNLQPGTGSTIPTDNKYPDRSNNQEGYSDSAGAIVVDSGVTNTQGQPYATVWSDYNPGETPSHLNSLSMTSNSDFNSDDVHLYLGNGTDVTHADGVHWSRDGNTITVTLDGRQNDARGNLFGWNLVYMVMYVPMTDDNGSVVVDSSINYIQWGASTVTRDLGTIKYVLSGSQSAKGFPYFKGGNIAYIQGQTNVSPYSNLTAQEDNINGSSTNLTDQIKLTGNLDGYPTDGSVAKVGTYHLTYSVTDADGHTTTFTRTITVFANQQAFHANPLKIYVGDNIPNDAAAYGATAQDQSGKKLEIVRVDTSDVNNEVPGTYTVTFTTSAGWSFTTTVTVLVNKKSIKAQGGSIYTGDDIPTDPSWYGASATNADGSAATITKIDTSAVNNQVPGTYNVEITASNGETTTVQIVVKDRYTKQNDDTTTGQYVIHYVDVNGKKVAPDKVVKITFTRTDTLDNETGQHIYGDWTTTDDQNYDVVSPTVANMTPDQTEIKGSIVVGENGSTTVTYTDNTSNHINKGDHNNNPVNSNKSTNNGQNLNGSSSNDGRNKISISNTHKTDNQNISSKQEPKNSLPNTGQNADSTILGIIGAILLGMLGLFGLRKIKK